MIFRLLDKKDNFRLENNYTIFPFMKATGIAVSNGGSASDITIFAKY